MKIKNYLIQVRKSKEILYGARFSTEGIGTGFEDLYNFLMF
jgi:hypothetical protein